VEHRVPGEDDVFDNPVLADFVVEIEVERIDKTLETVIREAQVSAWDHSLEVKGIWEDVIQHNDMAESIRKVHSVAETLGLADHRQLERQADVAARAGAPRVLHSTS
jgi:hypothetical protein